MTNMKPNVQGITLRDFEMDTTIIAPIIYSNEPNLVTQRGVEISSEIRLELSRFLQEFNQSIAVQQTPYYRLDAYFNESSLEILEVNAFFVDGWGTALNLARSSGISIDPNLLNFPLKFSTTNDIYMPELQVFVEELSIRRNEQREICSYNTNLDPVNVTYVYGREQETNPNILPFDGRTLDDKRNLARFSQQWQGKNVRIPRNYLSSVTPWDELPENIVLKFCDKSSVESQRARTSVIFDKPIGKAKFLRDCYNNEKLIAQDFVEPMRIDDKNSQLVILAIADTPITGYVQYSNSKNINDNSLKGPLSIK